MLRTLYGAAGATPTRAVVVDCQRRERASHRCLVLRWLGHPRVRGDAHSWEEWGHRADTPTARC